MIFGGGWEIEAERNPQSDRGKLVSTIEKVGGYDRLEHIYLNLIRENDGTITYQLSAGWSNLVGKNDRNIGLMKKLYNYGITSVKTGEWDRDQVEVEKLVLKDMLSDIIEENFRKLSTIITPSKAFQYKNLAKLFLLTPNPNLKLKAYQIYKEYCGLLDTLDNSKIKATRRGSSTS